MQSAGIIAPLLIEAQRSETSAKSSSKVVSIQRDNFKRNRVGDVLLALS
jgi:hypothetical protein